MQTKAPLSIPRSFEVIILSSSVKGVGRIIPTDVWEFVSERWLSIPRGWALSPSPESIFTNIRQLAEINNNDNIKNICFWQLEDPELFVKKYTKLNSFFMMKDTKLRWQNHMCTTIPRKKSRNGDTLGPVELIVWPEQGNQGDWREQDDQGEVSIIIFGMSKSSGFQKYSICWVFQALCLCLCLPISRKKWSWLGPSGGMGWVKTPFTWQGRSFLLYSNSLLIRLRFSRSWKIYLLKMSSVRKHWVTRPKNFIETDTETFFRDQNFQDRDRDLFSRPNIFETFAKNKSKMAA